MSNVEMGSSSGRPEPVDRPVAPGAPILVGDAEGIWRAGIAAVVTIGGEPHLLTCGHVFNSRGTNVFSCHMA